MDSPFPARLHPAPALRALPLLLALLLLVACGGGRGSPAAPEAPEPTAPPSTPGDGTLPPPTPPGTPVWDPAAASYGRTALFGSFSSDLVRHGDTLFAVDADQVDASGARILAFEIGDGVARPSTRFSTVSILPSDLVDSAGQPADPANPIGFGYYLDDLLIVSDTLGFVLVNAGGSDSAPTLSNVVAFDPQRGVVLETTSLAHPHVASVGRTDSTGAPIPGGAYVQAGAEALAWIGNTASTGRLYVAMSNLVFGAPSNGAVKLPGTVQVFDVDLGASPRVQPAPGPGLTGLVLETESFNPVALDVLAVVATDGPRTRLVVTLAGTTAYDLNFNVYPLTSAAVEAYDTASGSSLARVEIGLAGLAASRPALGRDPAGHHVGFYPSGVTGEIYLVLLDGLYAADVDASALAVLRGPLNGVPITAAQAGGPGGNVTGVALAPDGRTLAVTGFGDLFAVPPQPGRLFLLSLPDDLVTGAGFGADFTPGSTEFGAASGRTLAHVVLAPNAGAKPDVYVNVSGPLDASYLGSGPAGLGSLQTHGLFR